MLLRGIVDPPAPPARRTSQAFEPLFLMALLTSTSKYSRLFTANQLNSEES